MKVLAYAFVWIIFSSTLLAQPNEQNSLPEEISGFYQKCNIVKAFSSHEERSLLVRLLDENKQLPDLPENRIRYIFKLIRDIQLQTDTGNPMPNPFQQNAWKLQSSDLQQVQSWIYQDDDVLTVKIVRYSLPLDVNTRLILHFDDYQQYNFTPLIGSLQDQLPILSTSIHTWRNINGSWVKDDVEKVLVE